MKLWACLRHGNTWGICAVWFTVALAFAVLSGCATVPDPDLSARNQIPLATGGKPQAIIYADTQKCSSGGILLRSDFDSAVDHMCESFNAELSRAARQLGFTLYFLPKSQFAKDERQRTDVKPGEDAPLPPAEYRVVISHWATLEKSYSGSRVPTAWFGAHAFVYRNRDSVFLQKTWYQDAKMTGYFAEMAKAGRDTARQLIADLFGPQENPQ